MRKRAKIFSPDEIKTLVSQALTRDIPLNSHVYEREYDPLELARFRAVHELDKKYVSTRNRDEMLAVDAYLKFLFVNMHMVESDEELILPDLTIERPQSTDYILDRCLKRARLLMHNVLTPLSEDEWFYACKHGAGSSVGVPFRDTSLEAKSKLPWSVTDRVIPILERYLEFDSQLNSAVIAYNSATPVGGWYRSVKGSRATTVAKSKSIDRMIAIEPTGNMFFQQGLMECLYRRMRKIGLAVETLPDIHKERARLASITSKEATIDWSSASDCVSRKLLRWLLPPAWFDVVDLVRSPSILMDGDWVDLSMFSTMGNAVTFPLETLVFYTLGMATILQKQGTLSHFPEWKDRHLCSVFGDDCIVPSDTAHTFISVCESVGFIVNEEKSFYDEGGFRESCGGDYLRGYDVRPFNLKAPTSVRRSALEPWLYVIGNGLLKKYISCFGVRDYIYQPGFWTEYFLLFRKYDIPVKVVPSFFPDDAGLKISNDLERFVANYAFSMSRIGVDRHGSYDFRFCRFNYKQNASRVDDLHYVTWLKMPGGERGPWWYQRRKGGYVVAKGRTGHFSVPNVNNIRRPRQ